MTDMSRAAVIERPADPILAIEERWRRTFDDESYNALCDTTPSSMAGIAALAKALWDTAGPGALPVGANFEGACGDPAARMLASIWRAASGKDGLPSAWRARPEDWEAIWGVPYDRNHEGEKNHD